MTGRCLLAVFLACNAQWISSIDLHGFMMAVAQADDLAAGNSAHKKRSKVGRLPAERATRPRRALVAEDLPVLDLNGGFLEAAAGNVCDEKPALKQPRVRKAVKACLSPHQIYCIFNFACGSTYGSHPVSPAAINQQILQDKSCPSCGTLWQSLKELCSGFWIGFCECCAMRCAAGQPHAKSSHRDGR